MRYLIIASLIVLATPRPAVALAMDELVPGSLVTPSPSPSATPTPVPSPAPGTLRINEFLPNPVGTDTGNEWIELANVSDHDVLVGGVMVSRVSGTTVLTVPAATVIKAGEVMLFTQLSGSLINTGDALILKSGQTELDRVTYDNAGAEGSSWARLSATEGEWTTTPTPGEPNQTVLPDPSPSADPTGGSDGSTGTSTSAATRSSAAGTSTAAKKSTTKKLPSSGPSAPGYLVPFTIATLYWYARRLIP